MNIEALYQLDPTPAVLRLISFPAFDLRMEAVSMAGEGWFSAGVAAPALWASREPSARKRWWPWIFAFLCGVSPVYVGAHWMTDNLAGWLLGVVTAAAVCRAWPRPRVDAALVGSAHATGQAGTNEGNP